MEKVTEYYETHVKKWVDIAKRLHKAREKNKPKLIEKFGLQYVHPIDIGLIVEHVRRFEVIETGYVWKDSPASPIYYAAVDTKAFLAEFNQVEKPGSYVKAHYTGEESAIEEIVGVDKIVRGFYETLNRLLSTDPRERKSEYANLIRGIYENDIRPQTTSGKAMELGKEDTQFSNDLITIWKRGYNTVSCFFGSDPGTNAFYSKSAIDSLFTAINEEHIDRHYGYTPQEKLIVEKLNSCTGKEKKNMQKFVEDKMQKREIMEGLLVELHMMQTAINDYLGETKRV